MSEPVAPQSPLAHLEPLRARYGITCSLEELQRAVNLTFHEFESEVYDDIHNDMWQSLPEQFDLLARDIVDVLPGGPLAMLDVGCGTGLSSELMLRSVIGPRLASVQLLDTSPRMLARARERLSARPVTVQGTVGLLNEQFAAQSFDLIVVSSVLHHIPDLAAFLDRVTRVQKPGGVFLHIQDPNAEAAASPALSRRIEELKAATRPRVPKAIRRLSPKRVFAALARRLGDNRGGGYIEQTNRALMTEGLITRPMSAPDIWAITDIHDNFGDGIAIARLGMFLPAYELVSHRTYAFFGQLTSTLPPDFQRREAQLIAEADRSGHYLGAAWRHKTNGIEALPAGNL